MKILDDLLAKFGSQTVIIVCICILLVIFVTIVYRMFKLKVYRKEIIELENQMNAVKSLPIQYRLGRVKGIGKNMPEVLEKYNLYVKEFDDLNSFQTNDIVPLQAAGSRGDRADFRYRNTGSRSNPSDTASSAVRTVSGTGFRRILSEPAK